MCIYLNDHIEISRHQVPIKDKLMQKFKKKNII